MSIHPSQLRELLKRHAVASGARYARPEEEATSHVSLQHYWPLSVSTSEPGSGQVPCMLVSGDSVLVAVIEVGGTSSGIFKAFSAGRKTNDDKALLDEYRDSISAEDRAAIEALAGTIDVPASIQASELTDENPRYRIW